jgi:hypothetical protein
VTAKISCRCLSSSSSESMTLGLERCGGRGGEEGGRIFVFDMGVGDSSRFPFRLGAGSCRFSFTKYLSSPSRMNSSVGGVSRFLQWFRQKYSRQCSFAWPAGMARKSHTWPK